jgi:hypothetical protein
LELGQLYLRGKDSAAEKVPLNKKKYLENIAFFKLLLNFKKQACFSNYLVGKKRGK